MTSPVVKNEERARDVAQMERVRGGETYVPRIDIVEDDEMLTLLADLPGVTAEDLEIRFEEGELSIHGKVAPRRQELSFLYGEYGIGDFYRTFSIGEAIDSQKISAELKNGVLTLHLPKTEAVKPRRIEVKPASE
jgi:HSP20 family molecular chaperone IbpA